ncbi:RNA polymerase sigma factor [Leifsonia sp. NPDC058292]|uniref:RNA polymerase sigma factor n=1 Tax=Leifsonia sp. NPDC058292 TaxID=3346428 RepID=UPI0036D90D4A
MSERDAAGPWVLTDQELVVRYRAGNDTAAAELYTRHHEMAVRLARRQAPQSDQIDDIVSEAFTNVLEAIRRGGGPSESFSLYLRTTVRTVAAAAYRHRARVQPVEDIERVVTHYVDDHAELFTGDMDADLVKAFGELPESWRQVLTARVLDGKDSKETAVDLGISPTAERMLYSRARRGLKRRFTEQKQKQKSTGSTRAVLGILGTALVFAVGTIGWVVHEDPTTHEIVKRSYPGGECVVELHAPSLFDGDTTLSIETGGDGTCSATYNREGESPRPLESRSTGDLAPGLYDVSVTTVDGTSSDTVRISR